MKTIQGESAAWLSSSKINCSPEEFNNLHITESDMTDCGWIKVGIAHVTVELISDADRLTNQLAMLDEAERRADAECYRIKNEIQGQRQRLLAIEHKA